jgi:16S rRNA (cytosine1402-N4)-methyltransferase
MRSMATIHIPVMPREILEWLAPQPGETMVDGTLGGAGHTRMLAERVGDAGQVLSFDRDPQALAAAEEVLRGLPIKLVHANYAELRSVLRQLEIDAVDGILLDLGLSSDQLADRERGFSFESEGPLDLRFDPTEGQPAHHLLAHLREAPLADLIYQYGEERYSRRIARKIVEVRRERPLRTAAELADLVRKCVPRSKHERIDRATRTFQALRIAVNDELGALERLLRDAPECLAPGGRIAIISFHSLEDRIVKEAFRADDRWEILTKKPLVATDDEVLQNPRARSAKLRVARRRS